MDDEANGSHIVGPQTNKSLHISEAIQMQIEVQRRLHEQLEVQRHLQLRIEAQGKYLQAVLEKAQETLGRQNLGTVGLEAAKVQLSELVSKVSTQCLNSAFSGMNDLSMQATQPPDCSMDSCLTYCEGPQREQEMVVANDGIGLTLLKVSAPLKQNKVDNEPENLWHEDLKKNRNFLSSGDLSMSVGNERGNWNANRSYSEERFRGRDEDVNFLEQPTKRTIDSVKPENEEMSQKFQLPYFAQKLDLNAHDDNDAASSRKQFDLNGFSWC